MPLLACVAIAAGFLAEGSAQPAPVPQPLLVDYRRTGGIAGVNDHVQIGTSGDVTVQDRQGHIATGHLTAAEMTALEAAFAGWKQSAGRKSPGGAADAFIYEISFKGTVMRADESDSDIPEAFQRARRHVEQLAERVREQARKH